MSDSTNISFDSDEMAATFRVNPEKRTISGLVVPWGRTARSGGAKWRFESGSLHWVDEGRVKLNLHHDHKTAFGRATRLQSVPGGLDATFKIARGPEGDRAMELAEDGVLDGFSVEVDFVDGDEYEPDRADRNLRSVKRATLRGVALTAMPAYDDARVTTVAASLDNAEESNTMPAAAANDEVTAAGPDLTQFSQDLTEKIGNGFGEMSEKLSESVNAAFMSALDKLDAPQEGRQSVRSARFTVTREAPVYSMNGVGHSLVRDAWYAAREQDDEAKERLRKYRSQSEDMAKFAHSSRLNFATGDTTSLSEVIPPGYRPDLYIPELQQGRPFVGALSRGTIGNATPFVIPVFGSVTGATADHVEGTNPADGTLDMDSTTVSPQAVSGRLVLTREIVDSSNPAVDQIALASMREAYARQTESKVYDMLNTAQSGTITDGRVASGAQVALAADNNDTLLTVREQLALYPFRRHASPNNMLISQRATTAFATAVDSSGRPLLPSVGATNSAGVGNAVQRGWDVDGLPAIPAWSITGTTEEDSAATTPVTGDGQVFILNSSDAWAWESNLLTFRFEEKSGPALIELALFGYFATHLLRPSGLSAVRYGA